MPVAPTGAFVRSDAVYRDKIEEGGIFAPEGWHSVPRSGLWIIMNFDPHAAGRYHLYISLACPWAHRCLIIRNMKVGRT